MSDWLERRWDDFWNGLLNTVWYMALTALFGGGALATLAAWLRAIGSIPSWKFEVAVFTSSALGLMVIMLLASRRRRLALPQGDQMRPAIVPADQGLLSVERGYNSIDARMTSELDGNIRKQIQKIPGAADKETFLVKACTALIISIQFEMVWYNIFGSQLRALQKLNEGGLTRQQIFPFYADAAKANPERYATYSFDNWLAWARNQILLKEEGALIVITVKGRAFLKFLVDEGRSAANKIL